MHIPYLKFSDPLPKIHLFLLFIANALLFIISFQGAYALGSIDPSLYRISDEDDNYEIPPEHLGRIWFAVEYERETEKLLVTLIKARNLPNRAFGGANGCDPFVRYISTFVVCLIIGLPRLEISNNVVCATSKA